jgi:hypothetical protein
VIQLTFLCVTLIYVLTISAKVDMLKRTMDQDARYRNTKTLWLDKTIEVTQTKQANK